MSVAILNSFAFTCTIDGGTAIAVQKRGSGVRNGTESFSTEKYWHRTDRGTWGDNKVDNNVGDDIEDMPVRKLFNFRGPLSIDVSSAWYFIRICDDGHAPWIADEVKVGRAVAPRSPSIELMAEKRSAA